jgi:hypothetical protein
MPARVAGPVPEGPPRDHTTPPARGRIGPEGPVGPNRHFPRLVRCLQTRVWEGRLLQGGARGPEGARKLAL